MILQGFQLSNGQSRAETTTKTLTREKVQKNVVSWYNIFLYFFSDINKIILLFTSDSTHMKFILWTPS